MRVCRRLFVRVPLCSWLYPVEPTFSNNPAEPCALVLRLRQPRCELAHAHLRACTAQRLPTALRHTTARVARVPVFVSARLNVKEERGGGPFRRVPARERRVHSLVFVFVFALRSRCGRAVTSSPARRLRRRPPLGAGRPCARAR